MDTAIKIIIEILVAAAVKGLNIEESIKVAKESVRNTGGCDFAVEWVLYMGYMEANWRSQEGWEKEEVAEIYAAGTMIRDQWAAYKRIIGRRGILHNAQL